MMDKPTKAKLACALCGGPIAPETQTCERCGSAASTVGRCPQCQAMSAIEPSKELFWKCSVCGSARLLPPNLEANGAVQLELREATRAGRLSKVMTSLAYASSLIFFVGFILAFIITVLAQASDATAGAIFALPALMLMLAVFAFWKSTSLRKQRDLTLKEAYKQAILQLITSSDVSSTPAKIAQAFGIEPSQSERLLAELNVRDDVTSEVTEDGQIVYSSVASESRAPMTQPLTERLRVPEEPSTKTSEGEPSSLHDPEVKTRLSSVEKP